MGLRLVNKQFFLTQIYGAFSTNIVPYSKTQDYFRELLITVLSLLLCHTLVKTKFQH